MNTALNHTFIGDSDATKGTAKDEYNSNSDPSTWSTKYLSEFEKNLAIFDAFDGTCGNQFGSPTTGTPPDANTYAALASILADDQLYVNTASATCEKYLGVESGGATPTDCGGRKFNYEVIKITYTALAAGALTPTVSDGTVPDTTKTGGTTFPYFAPATQ